MWVKQNANGIIKQKGSQNLVATGITPSGVIHVGNMRETMTADLIFRLLKDKGKASFIYIADDFDRLRKRYPFLPKKFEKYVGQPLVNIPDPEGCHRNYSEHFLAPYFEALKTLDVKPKVYSAYQMYKDGKYTESITTAFKKRDKIRQILEEVSHRDLDDDWQPFLPLCDKCGRIDQAKVTKVDYDNTSVDYECQCGNKGKANYARAGGKMPWRVDWAARWGINKVTVEPFGKEHGAAGGSYDTAKEISEQVFDYPAPYPIRYEFIYLAGTKGKMASSTGNVISINDLLAVVPPEVARYLFASTQVSRHINFDPGEGLIQLINEYAQLEELAQKKELQGDKEIIYQLCQVQDKNQIPVASFRHLIETVQAAQSNFDEIKRILKQTGHDQDLKNPQALRAQIKRVENWLDKYAPEKYKFEVKKTTPKVDLDQKQKKLLKELAELLSEKNLSAEEIHNTVYNKGKGLGLKPKQTFEAIYLALLNERQGPKAGWFIASLDKEFVIKRFNELGT